MSIARALFQKKSINEVRARGSDGDSKTSLRLETDTELLERANKWLATHNLLERVINVQTIGGVQLHFYYRQPCPNIDNLALITSL